MAAEQAQPEMPEFLRDFSEEELRAAGRFFISITLASRY